MLDINQLRMEIYGLEEPLRQLFLEINYLKNMQERQKWSQTLQGKYFNVIGHFFSVYCLWKIFIVSSKLLSFSYHIRELKLFFFAFFLLF